MKKQLKYVGNTTDKNKRIWDEYENERGESTLSKYELRKISSYDKCDHKFSYIDNGNSAQCEKCGLGQPIILGKQLIEDGKIVEKL